MRYILFQSDPSTTKFVDGFTQILKIPVDFGYQMGNIYELESKSQANEFLSKAIIEDYKKYVFKIIKKKILDFPLVKMAYYKSLYTVQLYLTILSLGQFTGSMEELYDAAKNQEITLTDPIVDFEHYYQSFLNYKKEIIDKIEKFDTIFINDESTLIEIIDVIQSMKDLYQLDSYTFLKNNIYK